MKEIDLYLDLSTTYLNDPKFILAGVNPGKKMEGFDRFRITVRIEDKYFESPVDGNLQVQEIKQVNV